MALDSDRRVRIPVRLRIDTIGKVTDVKLLMAENTDLAAELLQELQEWRFAPARQNGSSVAGELKLTVMCSLRVVSSAGKRSAPRQISSPELKFPDALVRYGLSGSVSYEYTVTADGTVKDVVILKSSNPAFDEPVVEQLLQSRFEPAMEDGVKVEQRTSGGIDLQRSGESRMPDRQEWPRAPSPHYQCKRSGIWLRGCAGSGCLVVQATD